MVLTLNLLGSPQILWDGKPVTKLTSAKSQALLFYLAQSRKPHSRLELGGLLWPEKSDEEARTNLRQSLMLARKAISKELYETQRESVGINPNVEIEIDAARFGQRVEQYFKGDEPLGTVLNDLTQAAEIYQGKFLEGFYLEEAAPYDEWMLVERSRLQQLAIDLLTALVDHFAARRQTRQGLLFARRLLALEPLREESYQQLMRLMAWDGNVGGALAQYKACQEMLAQEFDLEPSPETELLYQRIKRQRQRPPSNLPFGFLPLVNRKRELADLHQLLHTPDCRLVTIMGQGGVGKSRTALSIAEQQQTLFLDGVFWIDLEDAENAEDIVYAIAGDIECRFSGSSRPDKQLERYLRDREMLLVLDNFEQLIQEPDSVRLISKLLRSARDVKFLITSRIRLNLQSERMYRIEHLALPSHDLVKTPERLTENHAVELFTQGAQQIHKDWSPQEEPEAVSRICRLVEGLPLGLQMAAALTASQSCSAIADALETNIGQLELAALDMPERHQSLRATFDFSFDLLDETDQRLLAKLSIFRGNFSAEAAKEIAGADVADLNRLITRSLVRFEPPARYSLHAIVRQLALEHLADEDGALASRYRTYYLTFLADQEKRLVSIDAKIPVQLISASLENVRHAWLNAIEVGEDSLLTQAAQSLETYLGLRGLYLEGVRLFDPRESVNVSPQVAARLLVHQAHFLVRLGEYDNLIEKMKIVIDGEPNDEWIQSKGRAYWAESLWRLGKYSEAKEISEIGLEIAESQNITELMAHSHFNLGVAHDYLGLPDGGQEHFQHAERLWQELGILRKVANTRNSLGVVAYRRNEMKQAREFIEGALQIYKQIDDKDYQVVTLNNLGLVCVDFKEFDLGIKYFEEMLAISQETNHRAQEGSGWLNLGEVYMYMKQFDLAESNLRKALKIFQVFGEKETNLIGVYTNLVRTLGHTLKYDESIIYYEEASILLNDKKLSSAYVKLELARAESAYKNNDKDAQLAHASVAKEYAEKLENDELLGFAKGLLDKEKA
ncbi:MAG: tetratricopeptide repeat protein [Chloroflexota bacterium]